MLGAQDLMIVLAIVLVLFGAKKLPELGRGIGDGIKNLKKGLSSEPTEIDVTPKKEEPKEEVKKEETEKKDDNKTT